MAMSKTYLKVSLSVTLKEATKLMDNGQQNCVMVVDDEDFLEGILTYGDIKRFLSKKSSDTSKSDSGLLDVCRRFPIAICFLLFMDSVVCLGKLLLLCTIKCRINNNLLLLCLIVRQT